MSTLEITRGDNWTPNPLPRILDAAGAAYNLTGATLWWTLKELDDQSDNDTSALFKLYWVSGGASSGITVSAPTTGVFTPTLTAAQTDTLRVATYRYDVQVLNAAGVTETPNQGLIAVKRDTTRRRTTP